MRNAQRGARNVYCAMRNVEVGMRALGVLRCWVMRLHDWRLPTSDGFNCSCNIPGVCCKLAKGMANLGVAAGASWGTYSV